MCTLLVADIVDVKRFVAIEKRQCVSTGVFTPLHCTIDVREFVDKLQMCRLNSSFESKIIDNNKNIHARKYSTTFTAPILFFSLWKIDFTSSSVFVCYSYNFWILPVGHDSMVLPSGRPHDKLRKS